MIAPTAIAADLTEEQRRIVEWGDGPLVVIAGAGTGKTRVIVERVRWLLETKGADGQPDQLLPEQILVLTYNVKAAKELSDRIEAAVGPAARARLSVSNFHSFGQRILTESAADAGLPGRGRRSGPRRSTTARPSPVSRSWRTSPDSPKERSRRSPRSPL